MSKKKKKWFKKKLHQNVDTHSEQLPEIKNEICRITKTMKTDIYRIGELLVKAKKLLPQGAFGTWVDDNFEFSSQQANNFMNVYRHCLGRPDIVETIKASLLYKITAPKFPDDLREHILANGKKLKKIKNEEFKKVLSDFKNGKLELDSPEIKKLFRQNKRNSITEAYEKETDLCIKRLNKFKKSIISMMSKIQWPLHPKTQNIEIEGDQLKRIEILIKTIVNAVNSAHPAHDHRDKSEIKFAA